MKYKGMVIYKNTSKGDIVASVKEAKRAIKNFEELGLRTIQRKRKVLMGIGQGKNAYWVIR
jgi:hypothetical protein